MLEGVVVVEVVEADDGVAAVEEGSGESAADEPGGAGEEDGHGDVLRGGERMCDRGTEARRRRSGPSRVALVVERSIA